MTLDRRRFLQFGTGVTAALAAGTLAGCSDDEPAATVDGGAPGTDPAPATTAASGAPTTDAPQAEPTATSAPAETSGGTVRVGLLASPTDSLKRIDAMMADVASVRSTPSKSAPCQCTLGQESRVRDSVPTAPTPGASRRGAAQRRGTRSATRTVDPSGSASSSPGRARRETR